MKIKKELINTAPFIALVYLPLFISVIFKITSVALPSEMVSIFVAALCLLIYAEIKVCPNRLGTLFLWAFILWVFYAFLTSPFEANNSSLDKFILLQYLVVAKLIISYLFANGLLRNKSSLEYVFKFAIFFVFSLFIIRLLGFGVAFEDSNRIYIEGTGNPIWYSRYLCLLLFTIIFSRVETKANLLSTFIASSLCLILIFDAGARGPVLSMAIVLIIYYKDFNQLSLSLKNTIIILALLAIAVPIFMLAFQVNPYSVIYRVESIGYALSNSSSIWTGMGLGSFGYYFSGEDVRLYPHNIFVEIYFEMGLFGLILFSSWSFLTIKKGRRIYGGRKIIYYIFLFFLLNAQFSGDITSNSYLFLFGILINHFGNLKARRISNNFQHQSSGVSERYGANKKSPLQSEPRTC